LKRIWVDQDKCLGCKSCELACATERDSVSKTLHGARQEAELPVSRVGVHGKTGASFPLQCRHCQDAPCLRACPAGAMQRDLATGIIFADQSKCRGCWMCVMSCPFGCVIPSGAHQVAIKCDLCLHREEPACVAACPTGALIYSDEKEFAQVLAAKRGRIAVLARQVGTGNQINLDSVREGDQA